MREPLKRIQSAPSSIEARMHAIRVKPRKIAHAGIEQIEQKERYLKSLRT